MLQLKKITKKYQTGELIQTALDGVSLNFRDSEFVAVLGPSGSGKTTLLNIVGGLDRYDSGDLIINSVSTKKYVDKDWDSYRNHTVGFVFQSYNLISHQSILSNVELALTISGINRQERRKRAKEALEKVGLGDQLHKKPNQLSGGQMQRVAIARALVNDPDVLLADEPTGALDTDTSVQVMDLLKEVAKDRLVVMVTHNGDLAENYATRIVKLKDGRIEDDSDPYEVDETDKIIEHKNLGKASMSFWTALSLSFNNLKTKLTRTVLISFAGSIGIIGIALILALSTGVNNYINDIQRSTMTSYPIIIEAQTIDLNSIIGAAPNGSGDKADHDKDGVYSNGTSLELASTMTTSITTNNLTAFKKYLDDSQSPIHESVGENGIVYSYDTKFSVFAYDKDGVLINTDGSTFTGNSSMSSAMGGMQSMFSNYVNVTNYQELLPGKDGELVGSSVKENYEIVYGRYPSSYDEIVIVTDKNNEISAKTLYELGLLPSSEYREILAKIMKGEKVEVETQKLTYKQIIDHKLYILPACDTYIYNQNTQLYDSVDGDKLKIESLVKDAKALKIVGIIRPVEGDLVSAMVSNAVGYTKALSDYVISQTEQSAVVKAQRENPAKNVITGVDFAPESDEQKIQSAIEFLKNLGVSEKAKLMRQIAAAASIPGLEDMGEAELAFMLDTYLQNPDDATMLTLYNTYVPSSTYDDNLSLFGVVDYQAPAAINIYCDSFEAKEQISACINDYNASASDKDKITYTDIVGTLMSSITNIVDIVSYVLIAFVSVSLIVSSIMIGIITYISVIERTKEIGILRAIGASKRNISQVFNAETFIIGLLSGLVGIVMTLLILIPGNAILQALIGTKTVAAKLPAVGAIILVILSVILTVIGGLIPAKKASKRDPVTALRSE